MFLQNADQLAMLVQLRNLRNARLLALAIFLSISHNVRAASGVRFQAVDQQIPEQAEKIAGDLEAGKVTKRQIKPEQIQAYRFSLAGNNYIRITIGEAGIPLTVTLFDREGERLVQILCRRYATVPLSFVSVSDGSYRLEIATSEKESAQGEYELTIETLRPQGELDVESVIADQATVKAEMLRADLKADSFKNAINNYKAALAHWQTIGNLRETAAALRNAGELYSMLGENEAALSSYNRALQISRDMKDFRGEIDASNQIGYIYTDISEAHKTREYCEKALLLSKQIKDKRREAQALHNLGLAFYFSSDLGKALSYFNQALSLWQACDDRQGQTQALLNLGYTHYDLGDTRSAMDYYNQALQVGQALNDPRAEALALTALGGIYSFKGEKQKALSLHNQALQILRIIGDRSGEAATLNGLGYAHEDLGERLKALDFYERALELYRAVGNRSFEALTMGYIGRVHQSLNNSTKALDYYNQKLLISRELGDRRMESYTLKGIGLVYNFLKDKTRALDFYKQALALSQDVGDRRAQAYTFNSMGEIYEALGEKDKALYYYSQALPLIRSVEDRRGETVTLYNLARAECGDGKLSEAREHVETSINIIESLRTKVISQQQRSSYFASVHQHYGLWIDILMQMHREQPLQKFDVAAFQASERARARSLLEMLAEAHIETRQGIDRALLEREQALQQTLNAKAERQMRLLNSKHAEGEVQALAKEIREVTVELEEVQARIRSSSPRYAALAYPVPLPLPQVQQELSDAGTVLLEYSLGNEHSYLWVVTNDSIKSYELPDRERIERAAKEFSALLTSRQPVAGETPTQYSKRIMKADMDYWKIATRMSQMLLGQIILPPGTKRLIIVAEGALQYVPFSALPDPFAQKTANQGKSIEPFDPVPLTVNYETVNLYSASILPVLRKEIRERAPATKAVVVFADPVFDRYDARVKLSKIATAPPHPPPAAWQQNTIRLRIFGNDLTIPRLPFTRQEAEAITSAAPPGDYLQVLDFRANLEMVLSAELNRFRIVHFATHGIIDDEYPELSGMLLSLVDEQGASRDGLLRLSDVYNLSLSADLVVLSACRTGLGKDVKGEGLIGLVRGFMYAGAGSVLASLWDVDDLATARFMKRLYLKLLKEGKRPSAALRETQVEMRKEKRWNRPYFWASFVLQGEWK